MLRRLRRVRTARAEGQAGFTVIELAVVLTILLVVLVVLGNVLLSLTRASNQGEALVANQQEALLAVTQAARDMRDAASLSTLSSSDSYLSAVEMNLVSTSSGRTVSDAVTVNGSTTLSSLTANFGSSDVGATVSGIGIPSGTTISQVTDTTTATLSNPAWANGTNVTVTIVPATTVEWVFDPTAKTLSRETLIAGTVTSSYLEMKNVRNVPCTASVTPTSSPACQPVFRPYDRNNHDMYLNPSPYAVATCTTRITIHVIGQANPNPKAFEETEDVQLRNQIAALALRNNPC